MLFLSGFGVQGRASLAAHGHREPGQGSVSAPSLPGTAVSGHIPQPWQFSANTFFKNRNFKNISGGWQKCPGLQVFGLQVLPFAGVDSQGTLETSASDRVAFSFGAGSRAGAQSARAEAPWCFHGPGKGLGPDIKQVVTQSSCPVI